MTQGLSRAHFPVVSLEMTADFVANNLAIVDGLREQHAPFDETADKVTFLFRAPDALIKSVTAIQTGMIVRKLDGAPFGYDAPTFPCQIWKRIRAQENLRFEWEGTDAIFAPLPPVKWLCEALQMGPGRPNVIAATPGAGKTITSQACAVSVATGRNVFNDVSFVVNTPGVVGHFDYDQGREASFERYQAICNAYGISMAEMHGKLVYKYRPPLYATDVKTLDDWKRQCDGLSLVIIDALHGLIPGKDMMNPDFAQGVYMLSEVSEAIGTTFLIAAHSPKTSRDPKARKAPEHAIMGTQQNFAAAGAVYEETLRADGTRVVRMVKAHLRNRGRIVEPFVLPFKYVPIEGSDVGGLSVTTQTLEQQKANLGGLQEKDLDDVMRNALDYIRSNSGCSVSELKSKIKGSTDKKNAARDALVRLGYARIEARKARNMPDKLFVTPEGLSWLGGDVSKQMTNEKGD